MRVSEGFGHAFFKAVFLNRIYVRVKIEFHANISTNLRKLDSSSKRVLHSVAFHSYLFQKLIIFG